MPLMSATVDAAPACREAGRLLRGGTPAARHGTGISRGLRLCRIALAGLSWLWLASGAAAAACGSDAPSLLRVGKHAWRVPAQRGEADAANGGRVAQLVLVVDGRRRWLVGSGPTPAFGEALRCVLAERSGAPVSDVVNTRAHPELALANVAFAGARLWALDDVAAAMARQCADCLERLRLRTGEAGESLRPESIRVPTGRLARSGATRGRLGPFRWQALALAPGRRTLVLDDGRDRLLIAQGLVWAGGVPNLRETDSALLLASLRRLRALAAGRTLLGEQGEPGGVADIDSHIAYLVALREQVRTSVARGEVEATALDSITLPQFAQLAGYATLHPLNRQRVWREAEAALFK